MKKEIKFISDKYGFEIGRHEITREYTNLFKEFEERIPEIDSLAERYNSLHSHVYIDCMPVGNGYLYRIFTPGSWFDLFGWR